MDPVENEAAILRAVRGDKLALQKLLCENYDRLQRHVHFRLGAVVGDRLSPEDILQETLVHAVRDIGACQARAPTSFFAWLKSIADNRLRDAQKKLLRTKHGGRHQRITAVRTDDASSYADLLDLLTGPLETPSQDAARGEAIHAIQVGVANLPEDQRDAIMRRYVGGESMEQLCISMRKSPGAVRGLLHRAKVSLRDTLGRSSRWFGKK